MSMFGMNFLSYLQYQAYSSTTARCNLHVHVIIDFVYDDDDDLVSCEYIYTYLYSRS